MYYTVKVKFESIDENSGRIRKNKEEYLVSAETVTEVEEKVNVRFKGTIADFIVSEVKESRILGVIN
jgi:hypothetical protein